MLFNLDRYIDELKRNKKLLIRSSEYEVTIIRPNDEGFLYAVKDGRDDSWKKGTESIVRGFLNKALGNPERFETFIED